jgi:hypothetical protein
MSLCIANCAKHERKKSKLPAPHESQKSTPQAFLANPHAGLKNFAEESIGVGYHVIN